MNLKRLDELDQKRDRFVDDVDILLDQLKETLLKMAEEPSKYERMVLQLRVVNLQEALRALEPLTPEELLERENLMLLVRRENEYEA